MMPHGKKKMTNRVHNLASYQFTQSDKIFIDTNIWLYLFPAPSSPNDKKAEKYSLAFQKLKEARAKIITDPLILSEYINT